MKLALVGPTDRGKSTLARALAQSAAQRFGRAWLLDLDVGQGSLPGTVTLLRYTAAGMEPERRLLVGRVQPKGAEGWLLSASARLAREAGGPWVADTDGWSGEAAALRFRYQQIEALGAGQVGVLEDAELYEAIAWRRDLRLRRLAAPPGLRVRSRRERRLLRELRLLRHLQGGALRELPLPAAQPGHLFALLDEAGWFLGYAALARTLGSRGLFFTPVRGEVARVVATWVREPPGLW